MDCRRDHFDQLKLLHYTVESPAQWALLVSDAAAVPPSPADRPDSGGSRTGGAPSTYPCCGRAGGPAVEGRDSLVR